MSQTLSHRRDFLRAVGLGAASLVSAGARADEPSGKEDGTKGTRRSILLSKRGGDRATGYVMSNKIARHKNQLVCTWIDGDEQNQWALVDPETGKILHQGPVGDPRCDNHGGAAIATAPDGTLHLLTGDHHRPFVHFRMPPDKQPAAWEPVEDGKAIGVMSTYPSLVCDGRGTLHLAYRQRCLPHYFVDYCKRPADGPWSKPRSLVRASVEGHTWMTNSLEVGLEGRLHLVVSHTRPLDNGGRYYGASHVYSDDSGETWRQFGDSRPQEGPVEVSRLKRIEGDAMHPERLDPKPTHWTHKPVFRNSYYHQILLSNLAVDVDGRPWVILHNILKGHARLYHARDGKWLDIPLHPAIETFLPGFRVAHCGQLSLRADGVLEAVLMVAPENQPGWGEKGMELVRMMIGPDGRISGTQLVCKPNPNVPHWLPSIERCQDPPVRRPALIYMRGFNASGHAYHATNEVNTEVWLQLP